MSTSPARRRGPSTITGPQFAYVSAVRAVVSSEVRAGRVVERDGRYRLNPGAFNAETIDALAGLTL